MQNNELIENAAQKYAQRMLDIQLQFLAEHRPARLASLTDDLKQRFIDDRTAEGRELANDILGKTEKFCRSFRAGRFQVSNKASRELFERVTLLQLPPRERATDELIRSYAREAIGEYDAKLEAERIAANEAEAKAEAEAIAKQIAEASVQFATGMPIDSESFLLLAKHYGVELHPRTIGAIRDRFHTLGRHGVTMIKTRKGDKIPKGIVYAICDVFGKAVEEKEGKENDWS